MEPPPPPPATPTTTIVADSNTKESSYLIDENLAQVPGAIKLRLMCSYGGHIIPTPHEKSLRYIGGETRMVSVDRRSSLASIVSRLSSSLLHGRRNFSLKYQLPNEELDNLVSLTSEEDLENLIEEYDRIVAISSADKPAFRIRIFVFFAKPETAASMGSLLDDAKSETWFVDALNSASLLPRGLSDSAVIDQLLDLDNEEQDHHESDPAKQTLAVDAHDVFVGMTDSPMVENSSPSYGSSSSSLSMSNLPPIRVRVEESGRVGMDEQFKQTVVSKGATAAAYSDVVHTVDSARNPGEVNQFQAATEDEKSDQSKVQVGFRKPPLPISLLSQQHKNGLPYTLPSPDSVTSDTSIASASSHSKLTFSQDPVQKITVNENRAPASPIDPRTAVHESSPHDQMMQPHETTYLMAPQPDHLYSQQHQQQNMQLHQLQQQHYYIASMPPVSETHGDQMPLVEQSDQHPNLQHSSSQNQRMQHLQETVYISSQQSTDYQQQHLRHQQQQFIHPSMQQSYETPTLQGPISEQLQQHLQQQQQQQQQQQFVTSSIQHAYHPQINQAEQLQEQQVQQQSIQGSMQFMHQASTGQVPIQSFYSMYTHPPHQQVHHRTMYAFPVAQTQPYNTAPQSNNIPDMSPARLPTPPTPSMLPPPASPAYKDTQPPSIQTQPETTSSALLMSANPMLIQVPTGQQQQQYISYSQFHHPPQSMATPVTYGYEYTSKDPQLYYTNQQHHPGVVHQYQTMNSTTNGHSVAPSESVSPLPPADQR
ncbi:unnamed protein product [Rhodiola kirilowii]